MGLRDSKCVPTFFLCSQVSIQLNPSNTFFVFLVFSEYNQTSPDISVTSPNQKSSTAYTQESAYFPEGKLWVVVDDDGTGVGLLEECNENNNEILIE